MLRYQLIHFLLLCRIQITYCFISNATALIASEYVKEQLYRRGAHNVDDRLAVIILKSSLDEFESKEAIVNSELFKCVELLSQHVADTTPLITYIFTRSTSAQVKENFKTNFTDIFLNANLILMYIEDSDWTLPKGRARNQALWVGSTRFTQDYRLMGTWRLAFPFMFSKFVGHKYFLFLDSDSFFSKSVGYNFITKMNEGNRKLGFIRLTNDNPLVTKGESD